MIFLRIKNQPIGLWMTIIVTVPWKQKIKMSNKDWEWDGLLDRGQGVTFIIDSQGIF